MRANLYKNALLQLSISDIGDSAGESIQKRSTITWYFRYWGLCGRIYTKKLYYNLVFQILGIVRANLYKKSSITTRFPKNFYWRLPDTMEDKPGKFLAVAAWLSIWGWKAARLQREMTHYKRSLLVSADSVSSMHSTRIEHKPDCIRSATRCQSFVSLPVCFTLLQMCRAKLSIFHSLV